MRPHPSAWLRDWGLPDPPDRNAVVLAYRRRAQRLHPDRAGQTPAAHAAFVALREQYGVLLEYSANPSGFSTAQPHAPPPPPRDEPRPTSPPPRASSHPQPAPVGWKIPAADLTLLLWWPLGSVWSGGATTLKFLRGVPCGCQVGCSRCQGTAVLLERVRVLAQVPPLPSRTHRVRLVGAGHRGDDGRAGDVWLEIAWKRFGGWRWKDGGLFQEVGHLPGAAWLYVSPPGGGVARLPLREGLSWTSPGGLVARVHSRSVPVWSLATAQQAWRAWRWGWLHAPNALARPVFALRASLACGRETAS